MNKFQKLYQSIIEDKKTDISFKDFQYYIEHLGFTHRNTKCYHFIYHMNDIPDSDRICIQPKNGKAKDYQVKQIRNIVTKYGLGDDNDDEL